MNSLTDLLRPHALALEKRREEACQLALRVAPADRERLERAIRLIYQSRGLRKPRQIIWFDSTLDMISMIMICKDRSAFPHVPGFEVTGVNKHHDFGFDLRYFSHTPIVRCLAEQGFPRRIDNGLFSVSYESAMIDELTSFLQTKSWLSLWPFILKIVIDDLCGYGRFKAERARIRYENFLTSPLFRSTIEMVEQVMTKKLRQTAASNKYTGDYPPAFSSEMLSRSLHSPLHDAFHIVGRKRV